MAMGIDQEIQRRMDAYRGNPRALQQRYQMSQQLLDLLALQKLKAEKDAMARQMQAQMQQIPQTVAQQMEQEMLGRTKQEMVQQIGGVMQQQNRQQQQAMQRMAKAAAQPRPMQGGIGALAPQTAQAAPRMAGGGIVAFQEGDLVKNPEDYPQIEALRQRRAALEQELASIGPYSRVGVVPPGSEEKYARIDALEKQISSIDRLLDRGRTYRTGLALPGTARTEQLQDLEGALSQAASSATPTTAIATPTTEASPTAAPTASPAPAAPKARPDMGGRGITLGNVPLEQARAKPVAREVADVQGAEVKAPKIDIGTLGNTSGMPNRDKIVEALGSLRSQTPEAARTNTAQAFETAANRQGIDRMYQDILGRLKASDARQMDPKKLAQEEFRAFLRGAAGKSTFGLAGAGGGAAAANVRRQQEMAEDARLMRELGLTKEAMLAGSEIGAKGFQEGMRAFEQASQDRRSAIDATITLSESDRRAYDAASDRKVQAAIAQGKLDSEALGRQLDRSMELLKFYSDEKQRGIQNRDALQKAASEQLQQIKEIEQTIRDAVYDDMAFQIQTAELELAADPNDAERAEELAALKQERARQVAAAMSGLGDNLGRTGVDLNALRDRWMTIMSEAFPMPAQRNSSGGSRRKDITTMTADDVVANMQLGG